MQQVGKGGGDGLLSLGYTIDGVKWWAERKRQVIVSDPDRRSVSPCDRGRSVEVLDSNYMGGRKYSFSVYYCNQGQAWDVATILANFCRTHPVQTVDTSNSWVLSATRRISNTPCRYAAVRDAAR